MKGGKLKASNIRDLIGTVKNQKVQMGGLISFDEPSKQMKEEIASADFYLASGKGEINKKEKIQFRTVAHLLDKNKLFDIPNTPNNRNYKKDGYYNLTTNYNR